MNAPAYQINGAPASSEAFYAVACDPGRSVAVEACAGAGKTWMLVARIVRALLDGVPAQDILAITFTKKAAGEMRERLQKELRACETMPEDQRLAALRAWGFSEAQAQARVAALAGLDARVVASGRGVQVRTFHSWFAALLRGAPLAVLQELGLPLAYELLEDDERATPLVWPRLYKALAQAPEARDDFFASVAEHGRHQTLASLKNALSKRVEFTMADAAGTVDGSVMPFEQVFPEMAGCAAPSNFVDQPGPQALLWDAARILGAASAPSFSAKGVELETALTEHRFAGVCTALLTQKNEIRAFGTKIVQIERVREAQALVQSVLQAEQQRAAWEHHQRLSRLTRVLLRVYADLKRERGWVDMNDLESAAQRLLADSELSGWMQQRMDARVSQLLIDEFQDTNPLQWQALYGWLSAYSGAGSGDAPSVFLVGDPKQSIYRFRRAEPQVFKAAQAFVVHGLSGALLSCDHTRRCAPAIVDALNEVMGSAAAAGEYTGFRAHTTASQKAGEVVVLPAIEREAKDHSASETTEWRDSLTTPRVLPEEEGSAEREAPQAARWVAGQIAAGLAPKHIMVLSRKRRRLAGMHVALQALGVPSEQPEKIELYGMAAVQDVVALLDVLVSPLHNLSLARALKSPLFRWSDAQLVALAQRVKALRSEAGEADAAEPSWWQALTGASSDELSLEAWGEGAFDTAQRLLRYRAWVSGLPPHDALSAIFEDAQVLARFAEAAAPEQRESVIAALRDVLAQSLAQEGGRFLSAYRLVRSLKAGGTKLSSVRSPEAVQLLTVHGAKGLEAHTVLLLDTDSNAPRAETMGVLVDWPGEAPAPQRFVFLARENAPPQCAQALLDAEKQARALEELNALYVALTRAERRLVVSSFVPHKRSAGALSWWARLSPLGPVVPVPEAAAVDAGAAAAPFTLNVVPALTVLAPEGIAVEAIGAAGPPDDSHTRQGLAMHRLLQWHSSQPGFDWSALHGQAVAREFDLNPAQAQEACAMARRVVGGEGAWAWDAAQLAHAGNEVEMVWQGQGLRLDRLVQAQSNGHWWVIDFKSHPQPEQQPEYLAQIRQYGQAVAAAKPTDAVVRLAFINALGQWREVDQQ